MCGVFDYLLMGLPYRSLTVLLFLVMSLWLPCFEAQSHSGNAPALDALLQDYAFKAFVHPKTGVVFDGKVPSNLTGIRVSGIRLRSGSLLKRGVDSYKEFEIPKGVVVQPYVRRLILVYQNLGSRSSVYYPLSGYTYLSPILGLLAYDARNLSSTNLPELDVIASESPIKIHFSKVKPVPTGSTPMCMWFNLQGGVNLSNVVSENTCSTTQQGHFALVVEGVAPSPESSSSPSPIPAPHKKKKKKNMKKVWIIVASVVGGVLLLVLFIMLLMCLRKFQQRKKMAYMEKASEGGEALKMTTIGSGKAPTAMVTRTQPTLESEYAP